MDKTVLLIDPPTDAVIKAVEYKYRGLHVVHSNWAAFQEDYKKYHNGKNTIVCYAEPLGYMRAFPLQSVDKIFAPISELSLSFREQARRILKFGGELHDYVGQSECKKEPGWLLSSYPRCGTHMLVTSLTKHSQLRAYGEVFNPNTQNGAHNFPRTSQVFETYWTDRHVGVAAHAYIGRTGGVPNFMPKQGIYTGFWDNLPKQLKVVSIRRRDLLERFVSHMKANKTKVWNKYGTEKVNDEPAGVTVDLSQLFKDAKFVKACWQHVDDLFPDRLVVFYEDLCEHWEREQRRIQEYLGVAYEPCMPSSKKLGKPLSAEITNYEKLVGKLDNSKAWHRVEYKNES